MHIDEFCDDNYGKPELYYVRWFFFLKRLPAVQQAEFHEWISRYRLYCDYEGKRYRVTGCSRLGDVWLSSDFKIESGYDLRVEVERCSKWSENP